MHVQRRAAFRAWSFVKPSVRVIARGCAQKYHTAHHHRARRAPLRAASRQLVVRARMLGITALHTAIDIFTR